MLKLLVGGVSAGYSLALGFLLLTHGEAYEAAAMVRDVGCALDCMFVVLVSWELALRVIGQEVPAFCEDL